MNSTKYLIILISLISISCNKENCTSEYYNPNLDQNSSVLKAEGTNFTSTILPKLNNCTTAELELSLDYTILNENINISTIDSIEVQLEEYPTRNGKTIFKFESSNNNLINTVVCVEKIPNQTNHVITYIFHQSQPETEYIVYDVISLEENMRTRINKIIQMNDFIEISSCDKIREVHFINGIESICRDSFSMTGCVIGGNGICIQNGKFPRNGEQVDKFVESIIEEYGEWYRSKYNLPCTGINIYINTN